VSSARDVAACRLHAIVAVGGECVCRVWEHLDRARDGDVHGYRVALAVVRFNDVIAIRPNQQR